MRKEQEPRHDSDRFDKSSDSPPSGSSCCAGGTFWIIGVIIGLILMFTAFHWYEKDDSGSQSDDSMGSEAKISWRSDYTEAMADAKLQNKPVLLAFTTSWCPPCKEMKKRVYPDPEVVRTVSGFVAVLIDPEKATDLAREYRVEGYPIYIVLTPEGERVSTILGYKKATDFVRLLRSAKEQIKID